MKLFVTVIILLILVIFALFYFFRLAFIRKKNETIDDPESKQNAFLEPYLDVVKEGMRFIDETSHKWVYINSFDGLRLAARYYQNPDSQRTIILFHGYRSSAKRDFSCAVELYYKMGFNVLLVDQRSHGKSSGRLITFGAKERYDVLSWINFVVSENDSAQIFLSGLSMGATTVMLAAGLDLPQNVKGIIADCGFTSADAIISRVARQHFHINAEFIMPIMDVMCRIFGDFSIFGVSTIDALKRSNTPIIIFHGKADNFVPCQMSQENYDAACCEKHILLVENASHGFAFLCDTDGVTSLIRDFINRHSAA